MKPRLWSSHYATPWQGELPRDNLLLRQMARHQPTLAPGKLVRGATQVLLLPSCDTEPTSAKLVSRNSAAHCCLHQPAFYFCPTRPGDFYHEPWQKTRLMLLHQLLPVASPGVTGWWWSPEYRYSPDIGKWQSLARERCRTSSSHRGKSNGIFPGTRSTQSRRGTCVPARVKPSSAQLGLCAARGEKRLVRKRQT